MIQFLDWDSSFLGYKVGKAVPVTPYDVAVLAEQAKKEAYRLLYVFVDNNDAELTEMCLNRGWLLADKKQTYTRQSSGEELIPLNAILPIGEMTPQLADLALQSGIYSRFKADPNFQPQTFEKLYGIWIERSVKREIATQVWGYYQEGQLAGMITYGSKNGRGDIGLLAVDDSFRGLGIGASLVQKAIQFSFQNKEKEIQVVTQGDNNAAVALYMKNGFNLESQINIFHLWL